MFNFPTPTHSFQHYYSSKRDVPEDFTGVAFIAFENATMCFHNGKEHREDGPAIVYPSRIGPVYFWKIHGKTHRLDGPARIQTGKSENNEYYIDDVGYTEEQYWNHPLVVENKLNKLLCL